MGMLKKAAAEATPALAQHCKLVTGIGEHWDAFDDEDRKFLVEQLTQGRAPQHTVTGAAMKAALTEADVKTSSTSIIAHRGGRCCCKGSVLPWGL